MEEIWHHFNFHTYSSIFKELTFALLSAMPVGAIKQILTTSPSPLGSTLSSGEKVREISCH